MRVVRRWSRERFPSWGSPSETSFSPVSPLSEQGHVEVHHAICPWQAALALFKCIVGPGVLFLPAGVKNAGLLAAISVSVVCGIAATWCMLLMLDTTRYLRRQGKVVTCVGDVAEIACGRFGRFAVDAAIVISQLGFCTAYCVFVAENLQAIIFEVSGGMPHPAGVVSDGSQQLCKLPGIFADKRLVYYIIAAVMPTIAPFTWIRQIRYFACTNAVATTLVVLTLIYMLCSFTSQLAERNFTAAPSVKMFELRGTLVYFGTAMYAFEGIGFLLPLERSMADPDKLNLVVCWTMSGACLLQVIFAGSAYLLYGAGTASIVTISLGSGGMLGGMAAVELVQLAWVVEVLLTLPLQLFPAVQILEPLFFPRGTFRRRHSGQKWRKNIVRCGLLLLCMLVATCGYSSVDNLIALIGALGCVPLAVVFPPLFHCVLVARCNGPGDAEMGPPVPRGLTGLLEHPVPHLPMATLPGNVRSTTDTEASGPKEIGGATSDVILSGCGLMGVILATVVAILSWIQGDFRLQECVLVT
mmetsp:Transcript_87298/g.167906  ORF Transcript_87298/g.167906 Transcript_87298/m.167906 type:complete len:527 (-) Transcript_87298:80-1660(-)